MASKHREEKVIAAAACPRCGAPAGEPCRGVNQQLNPRHGPACCQERRDAWREWKREREATA